jgi:hypothetical protein
MKEQPPLNLATMTINQSTYDLFIAELRALCVKHGVQLATSGYDSIEVWPLKPDDEPIHQDNIRKAECS